MNLAKRHSRKQMRKWYKKLSLKDKILINMALFILAGTFVIAPWYAEISYRLDQIRFWLEWHLP